MFFDYELRWFCFLNDRILKVSCPDQQMASGLSYVIRKSPKSSRKRRLDGFKIYL